MSEIVSTDPEPFWRGPVALYWRDDPYGHKKNALCIGTIYVGDVNEHWHTAASKQWLAWLMADCDGQEVGRFATEQEAKDALVGAALKELGK